MPVCHCTSSCLCPRSQLRPPPAHPLIEWMTPGTPEDSHLAVAPLHFSLPLKHNSELSCRSPNKRHGSCIFNLLTDAIILYTLCSLILMQLLLFIAGRFSILLFHLKVPLCPVCSYWGHSRSNRRRPTAELMGRRGRRLSATAAAQYVTCCIWPSLTSGHISVIPSAVLRVECK